MAPSSNTTLLLSFLFLAMLTKRVVSQNTSFNINAFTSNTLLLTYERDAFVPPDETYVRLVPGYKSTPDTQSVGRVLYTAPVDLWTPNRKQASFETTITLRIKHYKTFATNYGLTFFVIPVNSTLSTGGYRGNLGIYDALKPGSPFFTVEFSYLSNRTHDPDNHHLGININSLTSQNHTSLLYANGELVTARITYDVPTRKINVVVLNAPGTRMVSFVYNLRAILPQQVQVGLSASTGLTQETRFGAYFDIYTWHFNSTMGPDTNVDDDDIKQFDM